MTETEWNQSFMRSASVSISRARDSPRSKTVAALLGEGDDLVLFNAHHDLEIPFQLPAFVSESRWLVVMDTALDDRAHARTGDR